MIEEHANYIDGVWRPAVAEHVFEISAAGDRGAPIARFPRSSARDVADAVSACSAAEPAWQAFAIEERRAIVARALAVLSRDPDPENLVAECLGLEAEETARHRAFLARALESDLLRTRLAGHFALGGVYAVQPHWSELWVAPLREVLAALLAGRAVLLLSDPHLPFLAEGIARALAASALPRGVLALLHDDRDTCLDALLGDARVDTLRASGPRARVRQIERRAHRRLVREKHTPPKSRVARASDHEDESCVARASNPVDESRVARASHAGDESRAACASQPGDESRATRASNPGKASCAAGASDDGEDLHGASASRDREDLHGAGASRGPEAVRSPALSSPRVHARFGAGLDDRRGPDLDLSLLRNTSYVVTRGADPAAAAEEIIDSAFGRVRALSGQRPGSVGRVLCHERQFSRFCAELLARLERHPDVVEPLAAREPAALDHLRRACELGLDEGATLVFSRRDSDPRSAGAQVDAHSFEPSAEQGNAPRAASSPPSRDRRAEAILWPAVFTNVEEHMRLAWLGRPAPVLCLMRVVSDERGAALAQEIDRDPLAEDLSAPEDAVGRTGDAVS